MSPRRTVQIEYRIAHVTRGWGWGGEDSGNGQLEVSTKHLVPVLELPGGVRGGYGGNGTEADAEGGWDGWWELFASLGWGGKEAVSNREASGSQGKGVCRGLAYTDCTTSFERRRGKPRDFGEASTHGDTLHQHHGGAERRDKMGATDLTHADPMPEHIAMMCDRSRPLRQPLPPFPPAIRAKKKVHT